MINKQLLLILIIILDTACVSNNKDTNKMETLTLKVNAVYAGMIGYGYIYKCEIKNVFDGNLNDSVIYMTIMYNDIKNLNLNSYEDFAGIKIIDFVVDSINVETKRRAISGFVDMNKTSWKIKKITE